MKRIACGGFIRYHVEWTNRGAMAKLGSRLNGIQEAVGSNPTGSTIFIFVNKGGTTGICKSRPYGRGFIFYIGDLICSVR